MGKTTGSKGESRDPPAAPPCRGPPPPGRATRGASAHLAPLRRPFWRRRRWSGYKAAYNACGLAGCVPFVLHVPVATTGQRPGQAARPLHPLDGPRIADRSVWRSLERRRPRFGTPV